jgi:hypothetical protein
MGPTYAIVDEPRTSRYVRWATQPYFPLLALVMGGAWAAWPWYAFNSVALGSRTRGRELGLVAVGFVGAVIIAVALGALYHAGVLTRITLPYAQLVLVVWKIGLSYWLYELQSRPAALRQHYGGVLRNGAMVVVAAAFVRFVVLDRLGEVGQLVALVFG